MIYTTTPVGRKEIAQIFNYSVANIDTFTRRPRPQDPPFPTPRWTVAGAAAWDLADIAAWLLVTERIDLNLQRRYFKSNAGYKSENASKQAYLARKNRRTES